MRLQDCYAVQPTLLSLPDLHHSNHKNDSEEEDADTTPVTRQNPLDNLPAIPAELSEPYEFYPESSNDATIEDAQPGATVNPIMPSESCEFVNNDSIGSSKHDPPPNGPLEISTEVPITKETTRHKTKITTTVPSQQGTRRSTRSRQKTARSDDYLWY